MKKIISSNGYTILVDDEDYAYLSQFRWHVSKKVSLYYADRYVRHSKNKYSRLFMHRELMNPQKGRVIDHIDGNPLNNQRANLRVCTRSQNSQNAHSRMQKQDTSFKGVARSSRGITWRAAIYVNKKQKHLGCFKTELEAAQAYNDAALKYFGEFAYLNDLTKTRKKAK